MSSFSDRGNKFCSGLFAGGLASILTQPLEVIKTIILVNPLKNVVIEQGYTLRSLRFSCSFIYNYQNKGLRNFFKGGFVSSLRQSLGFALYTMFIDVFENLFKKRFSQQRKYLKYSLTACLAKIIAVTMTSPLILIKTRFELITQNEYSSIRNAFQQIVQSESYLSLFHGITSVLSRELTFSMFHYAFFRYLIDSKANNSNISLVILSYSAGFFAILFSHPFEVVRNRIMIQDKYLVEMKKYEGLRAGLVKIARNEGIMGFFKGILPRLVRKPINSAIVWSIYEMRNKTWNKRNQNQ